MGKENILKRVDFIKVSKSLGKIKGWNVFKRVY